MAIDTDLLKAPYAETIGDFLKNTTRLAILIIDGQLRIREYNAAFLAMVNVRDDATGRSILDYLVPEGDAGGLFDRSLSGQSRRLAFTSPGGIPLSLNCHIFSIGEDYLIIGDHPILTDEQIFDRMTSLTNELINMTRELHRKNKSLEEARADIRVLSGIVPICSFCKQIRDDKGYWNELEKYLQEHSGAVLSHGICPKCMEKHYPDVDVVESDSTKSSKS